MEENNAKILIVDDNLVDRDTFKEFLLQNKGWNFTFVEADNAHSALQAIKDNDLDCIILDFELPDFTGLEIVGFLKDLKREASPPVIMVTGRSTETIAVAALKRGVSDYIVKVDINPNSLFRSVINAISSSRSQKLIAKEQAALKASHALLEHALASRDEFMSIASHELKTPISALKIQLRLLARTYPARLGEGSQKVSEMLERAERQTDRLALLVNNLLDVTRLNVDKLDVSLTKVNLTEQCEDVLHRLAYLFIHSKSQFIIQLQKDVYAQTDAVRVEQVLTNFLTNASKYAPGGTVSVRLASTDGIIELSVSDSGPGIDEQSEAKIFDRFERGESPSDVSGLGLGLYISKKIALKLGGNVEVKTIVGTGSTFTLVLPEGELETRSFAASPTHTMRSTSH